MSSLARAQPRELPPWQGNGGLQIGVASQGRGAFWDEMLFYGGLRGDLLWGRRDPFTWGYGPMVGVSTNHFRDVSLAAGASVLVPVSEYLPLVFQGGPYLRLYEGTHPGLLGAMFWGSRSFNYHGRYGMAGGLSLEARLGLTGDRERTLILAAHLDAQVLMLPFLFLVNAFR
ncbi:MAG: hypothetical protein RMJ98_21175 [Myxococcales bacterium]|nr:hypothetical protein [Polyangiaceae bacterium]MDW8251817.1 hypothetical protein [Myxococcales bacterium]